MKLKQRLEDENPGLLAVKAPEIKTVDSPAGPRIDLITEMARVSGLESKINVLTGRLHLPSGKASVTLRLTPTSIAGSIVEGKHEWQVSGRRTSGGETRVVAGEVVKE